MTRDELVELLAQLEAQELEQSKTGIFNDRLLSKIKQVKALLAGCAFIVLEVEGEEA